MTVGPSGCLRLTTRLKVEWLGTFIPLASQPNILTGSRDQDVDIFGGHYSAIHHLYTCFTEEGIKERRSIDMLKVTLLSSGGPGFAPWRV